MFKFDQQTDACFCFVFFILGGVPFEIKRLHRDSGAKGLFNLLSQALMMNHILVLRLIKDMGLSVTP